MFTQYSYTLLSGIGDVSFDKLVSFDRALINAGVGNYNLVKVSSILPPFFKIRKSINVNHGEVLFTAYATLSDIGTGNISSAIGIGVPKDEANIGVIMEYSCYDTEANAREYVTRMVTSAMEARKIAIQEILLASSGVTLSPDGYSTVFAGVALW